MTNQSNISMFNNDVSLWSYHISSSLDFVDAISLVTLNTYRKT